MGRYLLLALAVVLLTPVAAAAMELEEMMSLPGAELLVLRANEVVDRMGPPAAIRDHGAKKGLPRHQVELAGRRAELSGDPWNLIYGKFPERDAFEWVNPKPAQSGSGSGAMEKLDTLVVYTHPDRDILDFNEKTGEISMRRAKGELEGHAVYGIASIPSQAIPWREFVQRWGEPDERTYDEKRQPVSRYWVSLDVQEVPVALFAVDALRGPKGDVLSVAIYNSRTGFVADRLRQMWEDESPPEEQPLPEGPLQPPGPEGPTPQIGPPPDIKT